MRRGMGNLRRRRRGPSGLQRAPRRRHLSRRRQRQRQAAKRAALGAGNAAPKPAPQAPSTNRRRGSPGGERKSSGDIYGEGCPTARNRGLEGRGELRGQGD